MKSFLKQIALFGSILLVLGVALDIMISRNLQKSEELCAGEFEVWNDIYTQKINQEILIYGSSRAWVHFNPEIIEKKLGKTVYNMGLDGQNFQVQYLRHIKTLEKHKPQIIIFSLDIFTLERDEELYNVKQFLPYMPDFDIYKYTHQNKGFTYFDYWLPLIRYAGRREEIQLAYSFLTEDIIQKEYRVKGYYPRNETWNKKMEKKILRNKPIQIRINNHLRDVFETCIADCKKANIQPILVYSPEHILGHKHVTNRDSIMNIYKTISNKYSVPFIDFSNDSICLSTEYFYNASHMNKKGSELFSIKVADTIVRLQIAENRKQ